MVNSATLLLTMLCIALASPVESLTQILYNRIGYIPQEDQINWTGAGLLPENRPAGLQPETPVIADHFIVLTPGGNCDEKIQTALDQAKKYPGTSIIFFSEGVYTLNSGILLKSSELALQRHLHPGPSPRNERGS